MNVISSHTYFDFFIHSFVYPHHAQYPQKKRSRSPSPSNTTKRTSNRLSNKTKANTTKNIKHTHHTKRTHHSRSWYTLRLATTSAAILTAMYAAYWNQGKLKTVVKSILKSMTLAQQNKIVEACNDVGMKGNTPTQIVTKIDTLHTPSAKQIVHNFDAKFKNTMVSTENFGFHSHKSKIEYLNIKNQISNRF